MMDTQKEREIFIAEVRQLDSFNFYEFSVYPFEFDEESRIFYFPPTQLLWETWKAAKAQTPVKLDRDTARQKLAMMWRGESTEINGRTVIFNESGCFDVRQDFGSGHFSQSLKATLDYLFQQRQSL